MKDTEEPLFYISSYGYGLHSLTFWCSVHIYTVAPQYQKYSVPIISWTIIFAVTLLILFYVGASPIFMMFMFVAVSVIWYLLKHYGFTIKGLVF